MPGTVNGACVVDDETLADKTARAAARYRTAEQRGERCN